MDNTIPFVEGPIDNDIEITSEWSGDLPDDLDDFFNDSAFDDTPSTSHELDEIPLEVDTSLEKTYMVRAERVGQSLLTEKDIYHHHTAKQRYEFENESYVPKDSYWASAFGYNHEEKEPCGRINTTKPGAMKFTYQNIPKNWTKIAKKKNRQVKVKAPTRCSLTPPAIQPPPTQPPLTRTQIARNEKRAMHAKPKNRGGRPKKYHSKAELNEARRARYRAKNPKKEIDPITLKKQGKKVTRDGRIYPIRIAQLPFGEILSKEEVRALKLKGAYYKKTGGYFSDKVGGAIMLGNDGKLYHQINDKVVKMKVSKDLTVTWCGNKLMVKQFDGAVVTEEQLAAKREKDAKRYAK